jgi:hypothetical protein
MTTVAPYRFVIAPQDLIPAEWLRMQPSKKFHVYNPAITRFRGRLLMAYRVDSGRRETAHRRIGLCELDESLQVISGSVLPLSDTIQGGGPRHYDPRFLVYDDRLFVHYNNNFMTRPNQIFLVELNPDTLAARSAARLFYLDSPRQEIEKNWMLFEHDGDLFAVYQIAPHTILRVNLGGTGPIICEKIYESTWDVSIYAEHYGWPRGGTPPVRQGDTFVSFFHSRQQISRLRWILRYWPVGPDKTLPRYMAAIERRLRRPLARVRYYAGAYAFAAEPPFRPLWLRPEPVLDPATEGPYRHRLRANPWADGIVYPCGATPSEDGRWLVSYGVHDERCCLYRIELNFQKPEFFGRIFSCQETGHQQLSCR